MVIQRLNDDSSWLWEIDGISVIIDPWFSASQIDLAPWFSEQFHVTEQPKVSDLKRLDYLFISHPFTDHCNKETLLQFSRDIPVIALPSVQRKMKKWGHFSTFLTLEEAPFSIQHMRPRAMLDLVHGAFLVTDLNGKSLLYSPHGSQFNSLPKADVLITTTIRYYLPFWLGGTVNLGWKQALSTADLCKAKTILPTHDEPKRGQGLVAKLAKRTERLTRESDSRLVDLPVGQVLRFD